MVERTAGRLAEWLSDAVLGGDPNTLIAGISFDSRTIQPGLLFVALRGGYTDGHRFLREARAAGAVAALVEPDTPEHLVEGYGAVIRRANTRAALAQVATHWFDQPSSALTLIGVTGTDGKTSTCYLTEALLNENDIVCGAINTVAIHLPGLPPERQQIRQTTPESLDIQRHLARMRDAGARAAVIETTSHALEMHRVDGCLYDVGVVTNVTHEHIDFHGTLERYRAAKAGLLRRVNEARAAGKRGICALNLDDPGCRAIAPAAGAARVVWYSAAGNPSAHVRASAIERRPDGCRFRLDTPAGGAPVELRLAGSWNISNSLAAASAGLALGLSPAEIARGLAALAAVPGRMERIDAGQPFSVVVDYAHTPDGLRAVLSEVRRGTAGRVLVLIGSAGERDLAKRAMLGAAAQELADFAAFTSDDPRFEDPDAIIAMIAAGAEQAGGKSGRDFICIEARRAAIDAILDRARPGDVVVLAGKGHELSQIYGDRLCPWDDAAIAREALAALRVG
jgi:UDP-N-acetylmuramoyl-L-alanyl-D-glutamate--2,6-diaminopimelate ligase